jgi:alkylation response protein AidB-like acyl-CoA dehydrogenase
MLQYRVMETDSFASMSLESSIVGVARRAQGYDIKQGWPAEDLADLAAVGAMRWSVPKEFGGEEIPPLELHLNYEQIATASVATALIFTQRDAAVGLIDGAAGSPRRAELLNQLVENQIWSTVGFAQLTTSRQRGAPAVAALRVEGGYLVNGFVPWCTGASESQFIVAGAVLEDGQQILFLIQPDWPGVELGEPMRMVALSNTMTAAIHLKQVMIEDSWVLRGPAAAVLGGRRNSLTLGQTFVATGLTRAALNLIKAHDSDRARSAYDRFAQQLAEVRQEVQALSQPGREAEAGQANARLRGACNELALRVTHAAIAMYKGTALLLDHPAQRLAREAMFLLVWSCPNPVIDCTVDLLSGA